MPTEYNVTAVFHFSYMCTANIRTDMWIPSHYNEYSYWMKLLIVVWFLALGGLRICALVCVFGWSTFFFFFYLSFRRGCLNLNISICCDTLCVRNNFVLVVLVIMVAFQFYALIVIKTNIYRCIHPLDGLCFIKRCLVWFFSQTNDRNYHCI